MNIIEDLENKIKLSESRISLAQKQLIDHENGTLSLSMMVQASTELTIEKNTFLLNKYKQKLRKLKAKDIKEIEIDEKNKDFIRENNYFKYQVQRLKHVKGKSQKEIDEALYILDELPFELKLEDIDIFTISHKSSELFLGIHSDLDDELMEIKSEFLFLVDNDFNDTNNELKLLNYRIPIVILQLRILLQNIRENLDDAKLNKKKFTGLPKFEDWWIQELWINYQAYMGLFRWKQVVLNLCISTEQKRAFEIIFKNWILIKKILNTKGSFAYFYNYAFDEMICKYAELEEEYEEVNLDKMRDIVVKITDEEDFTTVSKEHDIMTPYMKFKIEKTMQDKGDSL